MKIKFLRHAWFQILIGGVVLFILAETALVTTHNALFFPTVIMLGAFLVPVVFVTYFYEYVRDRDISMPLLTTCFVFGGIIGVLAAGFLEYQTLRNLNPGSLFKVGVIEEAVKLIFPIVMFVQWKYRHEADGLLFGVAAGMGFAALETMGYAMVALVSSNGSVGALQQTLIVRGLLSPSGHAAWTGFVCAILWRHRQATGKVFGVSVAGAYIVAVLLHALWDIINSSNPQTTGDFIVFGVLLLLVVAASLTLILWRFRRARAVSLKASAAATVDGG
jgi:RsiW-degrading membrane proteinase PrsW (M82 family)